VDEITGTDSIPRCYCVGIFRGFKMQLELTTANSFGVVPIAEKEGSSEIWQFYSCITGATCRLKSYFRLSSDGVFFQLYKTGVSGVRA